MNLDKFIDDELPEDQLHRTDDPDVWGLVDVIRGRTPNVPTTIYLAAGDSASGVAGLLFPNGTFLPKTSTDMGRTFSAGTLHDVKPAPSEPSVEYEVAWDGAKPGEEFVNEDGEEMKDHSHGLLLGSYDIKREVSYPDEKERTRTNKRSNVRNFGHTTDGTAPQGRLTIDLPLAA